MGTIKILSIDDSKAVHAYLGQCLAGSPYRLIHAFSGKEGLEILKDPASQINLILLDWEMPEQDGPDVFLEIRRLTPSVPVIMLTSKSSPDDITRMITSGVSEYVMKPFTQDIILSKIETVLGVN